MTMRFSHASVVAVLLLMVVGLLIDVSPASGHGIGLPQVVNVPNGPYLVSVWTDPDPLREDETHIVVAVMDPVTRAPLVEDVTVSVRMAATDHQGDTITETALSDNSANQLLYVVVFNNLISMGAWQATVIIDGPLGSAADVTFPLEITAAQGFNWLWLGIGGLVIAIGVWMAFAARDASQPRAARDRTATAKGSS